MTRFAMRLAAVSAAALFALPALAEAQRRDRDRDWNDGPKETERVERTLPLNAGGLITLKNFSGDIRITGSNRSDVHIVATRRATRDRLDRIKLEITGGGGEIQIDANHRPRNYDGEKDNVVETTFEIQAPASARLDVHAFSSDIDIINVEGAQKVKTFSGTIDIQGARAALDLEAFSGSIHADLTQAGNAPDIEAEAFSGDIVVRVNPNASGRIELNSFSGDIDAEIPITLRSSSRRRIVGDLAGGSAGTLKFKTFSGDVRVRK